jgi:hypothetical protein
LHLVCCTLELYYDARTHECQIYGNNCELHVPPWHELNWLPIGAIFDVDSLEKRKALRICREWKHEPSIVQPVN